MCGIVGIFDLSGKRNIPRELVARMNEQGHDVLYYENIEGGHGGAANNQQTAYMRALAYTFLRKQLE